MDSNKDDTSPSGTVKIGMESLSRDEIINKYKGVLNLAKKAKQAKDELAEENRALKEALQLGETQKKADKKVILTMKETLEQFTEQKLQMSTELEELHHLRIENESLRRQMDSIRTDNDTLLNNIVAIENQLKKVNLIGVEQKNNLELLELEVNRLKERDCYNISLEHRLNASLEENERLKAKEQAATTSLQEISEKYNKVKEINAEQRQKFNSLKDRFIEVYRKLKKLKECKEVLLETQYEYADAVTKWQNEIIQASRQLCGQMCTLQFENEQLKKHLSSSEESSGKQKNCINIEEFAWKLHELRLLTNDALKEFNQQQSFIEERSQIEQGFVIKVSAEMEALKLENQRLTQELIDLKQKLRTNQKVLIEIEKESPNQTNRMEVAQLEREKWELESELKTQEVKYEYLSTELESEGALSQTDFNSKRAICHHSYDTLLDRFESKEREHADLLGEMRELNEALKARGDVISRQEEKQQELIAELRRGVAHQKQLEASLSDKDQTLSLKNQEMQNLHVEFNALKTRTQELEVINTRGEEHIAAITEELQSLKQSGGTYDAQSDTVSIASNMSRADELNRLRELDESYEERYNKFRTLAIKLKKKLQERTTETNELTKQLQCKESLKNEIEEYKAKLKDLNQQQQLNDSLQAEIKKLKSSRKQANVLSLEIEAAEKSLCEVSAKLNGKVSELNELNAVLEMKESTIVQLRKEIAILEGSKSAEVAHASELKTQIDFLHSQIKDAVHSKQEALDRSKNSEYEQQRLQLEVEDLRLQLAQSASKQETIISELHTENTQLNSKLQEMESALSNTQTKLKSTIQSLENMRVEYMEYKVKAQTVLRKNQTNYAHITRERELEDELLAMRKKSEELLAHVQRLSNKLVDTENQLEALREDNEGSARRNDELNKMVEELRLHNDSLMQDQRTLLQTQQDALLQQREKLDNIEIYHKEQMEGIERTYQRQIEQLKNELTKSTRQPTIIGAVDKISPTAICNIGNEQHNTSELLLMEREDAEGSEEANDTLSTLAAKRKISNGSFSRRFLHDFMPLDELLNVPLNTLHSETIVNANSHTMNSNTQDNINANISTYSVEHFELLDAKERLQIQDSRLRHLTALLAENEQDLAKLTQMNDMLKEELRRHERSVEREQHMHNLHNSEYLKNVFMKFLTLNSVDERTRLVPVLNTILKLSRSEMEMLNCVAKGQKVSEPSTRSWSNFLPSWGSGGTSGN